MNQARTPRELLREVALRLGPLREHVMFVGGAVTWVHLTDPGTDEPRQTADVDVVVESASLPDYYRVGEQLRALGFVEDTTEGAPVCRWRSDDLIVDVMPTDGTLLGFSNRWYGAALSRARLHAIEGVGSIRIALATDFLAMKIDAYLGRGEGDLRSSKDMEDVVALVDGRPEIVDEIAAADAEVRVYVADEVHRLLAHAEFEDAVSGHLPGDTASQGRVRIVSERLGQIGAMKSPR